MAAGWLHAPTAAEVGCTMHPRVCPLSLMPPVLRKVVAPPVAQAHGVGPRFELFAVAVDDGRRRSERVGPPLEGDLPPGRRGGWEVRRREQAIRLVEEHKIVGRRDHVR